MRKTLVLPVVAACFLGTCAHAVAAGSILCTGKDQRVLITFGAERFKGRTLDCIDGDFVTDLTPCAPDGAFALSAGTGSAPIVEIVDHWQQYSDHFGGVTSHFVTPREIYFEGGFNAPGSGYKPAWTLNLDRFTAHATLDITAQDAAIDLDCTVAKPKL